MKADEGQTLKERGIALALDHAGDRWRDSALEKVREFCASPRPLIYGGIFAFEDIRGWALDQGLAAPPSSKAWGGIAQAAVNAGVLRFTGQYKAAKSPQTHGHPVKLYCVGNA